MGARGPKKGSGGRPRADLNWAEIKKLGEIHCTEAEVAAFCDTSPDTLNRRCQEKFGKTFAEYLEERAANGRRSLRRQAWQRSKKSDKVLIVLMKNELGMAEKGSLKVEGSIDITGGKQALVDELNTVCEKIGVAGLSSAED